MRLLIAIQSWPEVAINPHAHTRTGRDAHDRHSVAVGDQGYELGLSKGTLGYGVDLVGSARRLIKEAVQLAVGGAFDDEVDIPGNSLILEERPIAGDGRTSYIGTGDRAGVPDSRRGAGVKGLREGRKIQLHLTGEPAQNGGRKELGRGSKRAIGA